MRSLVLLSFLGIATSVAAECCKKPFAYDYCDDGTLTSTFGCCGIGPCNIFCCNCDDGCRVAKTKRNTARDVASWGDWAQTASSQSGDSTCGLFESENQCALDKFEALDTNHDGFLTLAECLVGVDVLRPALNLSSIDEATIKQDVTILFNAYDTDKNGDLTFAEALTPQAVDFSS